MVKVMIQVMSSFCADLPPNAFAFCPQVPVSHPSSDHRPFPFVMQSVLGITQILKPLGR